MIPPGDHRRRETCTAPGRKDRLTQPDRPPAGERKAATASVAAFVFVRIHPGL